MLHDVEGQNKDREKVSRFENGNIVSNLREFTKVTGEKRQMMWDYPANVR